MFYQQKVEWTLNKSIYCWMCSMNSSHVSLETNVNISSFHSPLDSKEKNECWTKNVELCLTVRPKFSSSHISLNRQISGHAESFSSQCSLEVIKLQLSIFYYTTPRESLNAISRVSARFVWNFPSPYQYWMLCAHNTILLTIFTVWLHHYNYFYHYWTFCC